jgi:hypothetical protein
MREASPGKLNKPLPTRFICELTSIAPWQRSVSICNQVIHLLSTTVLGTASIYCRDIRRVICDDNDKTTLRPVIDKYRLPIVHQHMVTPDGFSLLFLLFHSLRARKSTHTISSPHTVPSSVENRYPSTLPFSDPYPSSRCTPSFD